MPHDSYEYLITVYEAHDRLGSWEDHEAIADVADRLRAIAPDHQLVPLLEAKWRSMVEHVMTPPTASPLTRPIEDCSVTPLGTAHTFGRQVRAV